MIMNRNYHFMTAILAISVLVLGCAREWLDFKPDKQLVVPTTLQDYKALLSNSSVMNTNSVPALGEIGSDDYYLTEERWVAHAIAWEKNAYSWEKEVFVNDAGDANWSRPYGQIYYSNLVLKGLNEMNVSEQDLAEYYTVKGWAHFFRAFAYYQLAQVFVETYEQDHAQEMLGLPLIAEPDLETVVKRATLDETYTLIHADLQEATRLLPSITNSKTLPTKAAAYALLAKYYLNIADYENALKYAENSLAINDYLIDYNNLNNITANYPIIKHNNEVLFHTTVLYASIIAPTRMNIATDLYNLYGDNDLRKAAFFRETNGAIVYKGSYTQSSTNFGGITTAEMYLVKAECEYRQRNSSGAKNTLKIYLKSRYTSNEVLDLPNEDELLKRILQERRKELVMRGIRWCDIRRYNNYDNSQEVLDRKQEFIKNKLQPGDKRFVWPIPMNVINLSNIEQNVR